MKKHLLKFLIGGTFLLAATLAHASGPFRPVVLSTNPVTQQSGAYNVQSGTMATLSVTGNAALTNTSISSVTANINMAGHKITAAAAGTASTDGVIFSQLQSLGTAVISSLNTRTTTTNTSFTNTSLTANITISSNTSRVFGWVSGSLDMTGAAAVAYVTVARGVTNIGDATNGLSTLTSASATEVEAPCGFVFIDTPLFQGTTTYTVQIKSSSGSGTAKWNANNPLGQLILLEIK